MANIDSRYTLNPSLQEYFVDKDTGAPLSAGIVRFFADDNRAVGKDVYSLSGSYSGGYTYVNLGSVLTLSSVGTFMDDDGNDIIPYLYCFTGSPDDAIQGTPQLYYVTVESSGGVPQFTRQAWPNSDTDASVAGENASTQNLISNPQFVEVNFSPTTNWTTNVTGSGTVTNIAPDWAIITNGTGTITLSQNAIAEADFVTNPPYSLSIAATGVTLLQLRQRLQGDTYLFSGQYVSASFAAASLDNAGHILTLQYIGSSGVPMVTLATGQTTADNNFSEITGNALIPDTNTGSAPTGYVDVVLTIANPAATQIQVSSFQLVGVANSGVLVSFSEQTIARQTDHLFHYYKDELVIRPKSTILTGWDFKKNPYQFISTAVTTVAASGYTLDQTFLCVENINSLSTQQGTTGMFQINAIAAATQGKFALVQFVDPNAIASYWNEIVSSLVRMGITTTNGTVLKVKMRLLASTTAPGGLSPILAWNAVDTDPTFTTQWNAISPSIPLNDPVFTVDSTIAINEFSFNSIQMQAQTANPQYFAIVLYTEGPLTSSGTPDSVYFERISLVPNRFAVDVNPITFDDTLRQCQYYYEKSYSPQVFAGAPVAIGAQFFTGSPYFSSSTSSEMHLKSFEFQFKQNKRTVPSVTFYSPTGAAAVLQAGILRNGAFLAGPATGANPANYAIAGNYTSFITDSICRLICANTTGVPVTFNSGVTAADPGDEAVIIAQYVADARL